MWFIKALGFVICIYLVFDTHAQVQQVARFEVDITNSEDAAFDVIPAYEHGVFLHRRLSGPKIEQLEFIRLDSALVKSWHGFLTIDNGSLLVGQTYHQERLCLLLRSSDYRKNDLSLFIINDKDGSYSKHIIKGYIPFMPTEFRLTEKAVIIGGYFNRVPVVLYFSFLTEKSRVLPGIFNEIGELNQIQVNDDGTFNVLISALNYRKQRCIWIRNYDSEGNLLANSPVTADDGNHLIFGRSVVVNNQAQLVAGVYGTRSQEYSRGIFIASLNPAGVQQMKYYPFTDLENFFKYLKPKRQDRIRTRIEKRKMRGKKIRMSYRFLVHEIVPYGDQFVLLGEAFYPKYTTVNRSQNGFFLPYRFSGSMLQNDRVFDGYHYTHAVVMGFNGDGTLAWDNSFEINDVRSFKLEQFVKLQLEDDQIDLIYLFDNKIRTKRIANNRVVEGKTEVPIQGNLPGEVARSARSNTGKLEYAYGNYYYGFGSQDIENASKEFRRRVFYVSKIKQITD
ncbi:MAG TPA: hypothetical protein VD927_11935 [Chryseosolibacter sp.]|nr:hypothetical protein [Chryseosolibacter sp.]